MKTVETEAALRKMAVNKKATTTGPTGQQFNSKRDTKPNKMLQKAAENKKAKPEKEKQTGPDEGAILLAAAIQEAAEGSAAMMENVSEQIANIQLQAAAPPTEWVFDLEHGKVDGETRVIRIKASAPKVVLN